MTHELLQKFTAIKYSVGKISLLFYLFMVVCVSNFQKANFKFQFQENNCLTPE